MLILSHGKRLEALKHREKYITQDDIDKRDDVLSVDYGRSDYDIVILNDHQQATVEETTKRIQEELKRPTLKVNMHLDEFEPKKQEVITKQNARLKQVEPFKVLAYKMLVDYRKIKNTIELNGSFKKELSLNRTLEQIEEHRRVYAAKIDKLLEEARKLFGENVEESNLQEILESESHEVSSIIEECKEELKQVAEDTNLTISSSIYIAPEQLRDGKLQKSKDVLNVAGECGDWVFAQSGTLVDNPYLLRKSGKGVCAREGACMPGDTGLLQVKDGRAILTEPVYVYLMKTTQFEPVVTVDYMPNGEPAIRFEGEWTSDKDIDRANMRVKSYRDVTEMLEYLQLFSAQDRETYEYIANLPKEKMQEMIKQFLKSGKLQYINGESGMNVNEQLLGKTTEITSTRDLLEQKLEEYRSILLTENPETIKKAFQLLHDNRKKIHSGEKVNLEESLDGLDDKTKRIFALMRACQQDIKQLFIENDEVITHITNVSPENMIGGKIIKSLNRANNYETECGDWVFASSEPVDGKNPYIARNSKTGMISLGESIYIYGGDNMQVQHDEQGKDHVLLKEPNYVYKINPKNFTPVVTLTMDKNGKPCFEFSEEWISNQDLDINNSEQVIGVEQILDVTSLLENYQVFCDVNMTGEARKIRSTGSMEKGMQALIESVSSGKLRYINGEANVNVVLELNKGREKDESSAPKFTLEGLKKHASTARDGDLKSEMSMTMNGVKNKKGKEIPGEQPQGEAK